MSTNSKKSILGQKRDKFIVLIGELFNTIGCEQENNSLLSIPLSLLEEEKIDKVEAIGLIKQLSNVELSILNDDLHDWYQAYFLNGPFPLNEIEDNYHKSNELLKLMKIDIDDLDKYLILSVSLKLSDVKKLFSKIDHLIEKEKIVKILIKKPTGTKADLEILVNDTPLSIQRTDNWNKILTVAMSGECLYDENLIKYFNNRKDNAIYANTKFKPTKILEKSGALLKPAITIKTVNKIP